MIRLYTSSDLFRPYDPPRQTQTSVAKYIVRADGHDLEYTDRDTYVPDIILNQWTNKNKETWLPRVVEDGVKIHDVFHKYGQQYDFNPQKVPTSRFCCMFIVYKYILLNFRR